MTLDTFFKKFDQFAAAPDAVAKMRELVLNLAIQGGLVPHLTKEAAVPYKSVEKAKALNVSAVPSNWRIVLLSDAIKNRSGNSKLIKGTLFDAPASNRYQGFSASGADVWCGSYEHEGDAIIISAVGARCGKAFKASGKWCAIANTNIARPDPSLLDFEFAFLVLNDENFWVRGGSAQPFVKFPPSLNRHFALPPLAEQKRIVAKVDELMALCDRLEAQQQERDEQASALARASLARFAEAPTPANLNLLFHKSYSIPPAELRQSILTMAVRGKLVPQDSNEGDVEGIVKEARKQAGLLARSLGELDSTELPFDAPSSWRWVTVADVAQTRLGKMLDQAKNRGEPHPYLRNTNVHWFRFELDSIKTMPLERKELDEYRLEEGDVLICEGGHGIARSAVWEGQIPGMTFQKALHRVRPLACLDGYFLTFCLWLYERESLLQRYYTGAGIPHFTGKALARVLLPLPPIAEQRRIVAKVDQLMALVDQLETHLADSRAVAKNLLESLIAELSKK